MLCYIILYYTTLHYTTLHYTTLHYTILYYTILYYTTLHYTILYWVSLPAAPLNPLDDRPTLSDLDDKVVKSVSNKWFSTGLELNIEKNVLETIQMSGRNTEQSCREMFRCWLAKEQGYGSLPRTWSSVLHAVENSCGNEVSRELSELLHQRVYRVNSPSTCLPHSGTTSCE